MYIESSNQKLTSGSRPTAPKQRVDGRVRCGASSAAVRATSQAGPAIGASLSGPQLQGVTFFCGCPHNGPAVGSIDL